MDQALPLGSMKALGVLYNSPRTSSSARRIGLAWVAVATVAVTTAVPSEEATTAAQSSAVAEATENKPAALATETKSATEKAAVAAATESGLPSSNKPGAATLHLEKTNESGGNRW